MPVVPNAQTRNLIEAADEESALHKKYGMCFDQVDVATLPENYEETLTEIFAGEFRRLRLSALNPYDVALAKIERNINREEVKF